MNQKQAYLCVLLESPFVALSTTPVTGAWFTDTIIKTFNPRPGSTAWEAWKATLLAYRYISRAQKWKKPSEDKMVVRTCDFLEAIGVALAPPKSRDGL
jgi:hypothetical protein